MSWISINEGYPENAGEVLIAIKYNSIPVQGYWSKTRNKWFGSMEVRENMIQCYADDPELQAQEFITHWQPLPEPPKQ